MHRIRKAAIAAVWFMLLTLPVLGIKLNTVDRTVSWRFDRILILGVAIFGLALIWDWCFTRKARGLPLLSLPHTGGLPARLALLRERPRVLAAALGALLGVMVIMPWISSFYQTNIMISALLYVMLALGLNIVVAWP